METLQPYLDGPFVGIDLDSPAEMLAPGVLTQADNVFLDSGDLVTRPGWAAMLTTPVGTGRRITSAFPFRYSGENYALLAIRNAGATGDQIWLWQESAPTVFQNSGGPLSPSILFNSGQVQFAQLRGYVFISGSQDGKLYRFSVDLSDLTLEPTVGGTAGATTPTRKVAAVIGSQVLVDWSTCTIDSDTGTTYVPQTQSTVGCTTTPTLAPNLLDGGTWQVFSGEVEAHFGSFIDPVNPTQRYLRLDYPTDSVLVLAPFTSASKYNTQANVVNRYTNQFVVSLPMRGTSANSALLVTVYAYNTASPTIGTTAPIAQITKLFTPTSTSAPQTISRTFSFAGIVDDTQVLSVGVLIAGGPNVDTPDSGPYVGGITVTPQPPTGSAGTYEAYQTSVTGSGSGVSLGISIQPTVSDPQGDDSTTLLFGYNRVGINLGSSTAMFATVEGIAIPVTEYLSLNSYNVQLGFLSSLTSPPVYIPLTRVVDTTGTYWVADLSTINSNAILSATQWLELNWLQDLTTTGTLVESPTQVFALGALTDAGPLSVGYNTYEYRYREKTATTLYTSKATLASNSITPTQYKRTGLATVSGSVPQNSGAALEWWRRGGTFADGLWRKLTELDTPGSDYSDAFVSWDHTTRTLTDQTPDSALLDVDLLTDHDPPPFGANSIYARAVGVHGPRVVVATDDGIYLSQVPQALNDPGMYWDLVTDPLAVDVSIRGLYTKLSGQQYVGGDTIQRLLVMNDDLVIFFRTSRYQLIGTDPSNYQVRRYESDRGRGLLTPTAVEVAGGLVWYISQDGLRAWDGVNDARRVQGIERAVYPAGLFAGLEPNYAVLEQSCLELSAGRLFLTAPYNTSDTECTALYVLDSRFGWDVKKDRDEQILSPSAWTRWWIPDGSGGRRGIGCLWTFGNTPASGVSAVTDTLYAATSDGQLWRLQATQGDILTAGGSPVAVAVSITSRKFRVPDVWLRPERLTARCYCSDASPTATFSVIGDQTYSLSYSLDQGQNQLRNLEIPHDSRGNTLQWQVTASTVAAFRLQEMILKVSPEGGAH